MRGDRTASPRSFSRKPPTPTPPGSLRDGHLGGKRGLGTAAGAMVITARGAGWAHVINHIRI